MNHPTKLTRRRFAKSVAAGGAAALTYPYLATSRAAAAESDRPRIACIGVGSQGAAISRSAKAFGDIVAVCDADLAHAEQFRQSSAPDAELYQDYRRVLEREDVDVVIQATPDHWHTKINIEACLAGKDVYGEKPLTLTIDEGKQLRDVVKRTGRVFQTGTNQRSDPHFQTAVELVRNGRVGELKEVWVALPFYTTNGGPFAEEATPQTLDWDLYLGQAPRHYYTHHRAHKIFRWWYEYAGGITTDWGNHHVDIAHWGMDCEHTGPVSVDARGLFPNDGKAECFNTADRFFSRMKYASGIDVLFFSAMNDRRVYGEVAPHVDTPTEILKWLFGDDCPEEVRTFDRNGIMFIGDKGRVFVNRGGVYGKAFEDLSDNPLSDDAWKVRPSHDHMKNFFDCVRTRQTPVAPVEIEHRTVTACHLTNLSLRLGRPLTWDADKEQIVGDDEANAWLSREQRPPYGIKSA